MAAVREFVGMSGPQRWAVLQQLRMRAERLKREFEASEEPERTAALLRWQAAVDEFTDVLLGVKQPPTE
jgi:hypothetical protein